MSKWITKSVLAVVMATFIVAMIGRSSSDDGKSAELQKQLDMAEAAQMTAEQERDAAKQAQTDADDDYLIPGGIINGETVADSGWWGSWGGRFFGNGSAAIGLPSAFAGTFGATDGTRSFAGSFGARRQPQGRSTRNNRKAAPQAAFLFVLSPATPAQRATRADRRQSMRCTTRNESIVKRS